MNKLTKLSRCCLRVDCLHCRHQQQIWVMFSQNLSDLCFQNILGLQVAQNWSFHLTNRSIQAFEWNCEFTVAKTAVFHRFSFSYLNFFCNLKQMLSSRVFLPNFKVIWNRKPLILECFRNSYMWAKMRPNRRSLDVWGHRGHAGCMNAAFCDRSCSCRNHRMLSVNKEPPKRRIRSKKIVPSKYSRFCNLLNCRQRYNWQVFITLPWILILQCT